LELVAQIHIGVSTAAWRERKQTLLYNILLTKIFFSTGIFLFFFPRAAIEYEVGSEK
jgi:hypothetical protein